jgi:hypothetical protein
MTREADPYPFQQQLFGDKSCSRNDSIDGVVERRDERGHTPVGAIEVYFHTIYHYHLRNTI